VERVAAGDLLADSIDERQLALTVKGRDRDHLWELTAALSSHNGTSWTDLDAL
jgi:hypothetical protein